MGVNAFFFFLLKREFSDFFVVEKREINPRSIVFDVLLCHTVRKRGVIQTEGSEWRHFSENFIIGQTLQPSLTAVSSICV